MAKISEELKDFLKNHLAFVATVDGKGRPNVVPKGNLGVSGDAYIVFADLYSHQTQENLKQNPYVAVTVVNPAGYRGYQCKGKAKIIAHGKEYDALAKELSGEGQLNHPEAKYAVKIKVDKIIDIGYGETADKEV